MSRRRYNHYTIESTKLLLPKSVMKLLLSITLALVTAISAFATAQSPDRIVYKGKERMLFSNPLEGYYSSGRKRPDFMIAPLTTSTGNWRGYVAMWQIENGKLYLTKIDSWLCRSSSERSCRKVSLAEIFKEKVKNGKVLADWFLVNCVFRMGRSCSMFIWAMVRPMKET